MREDTSKFKPDIKYIKSIPIYKIGDTVVVESFKNLSEVFEPGAIETIHMPYYFGKHMERFCGEKATVTQVSLYKDWGWEYWTLDIQRLVLKFDNPELADSNECEYMWNNLMMVPHTEEELKEMAIEKQEVIDKLQGSLIAKKFEKGML